jgi:dCTP deaminase
MILTGTEIRKQHSLGTITIDRFEEKQLNPNSYDFRLGPWLRTYDELELDAARNNPSSLQEIPPQGLLLEPARIYLGHTVEVMGSESFVPIIRAKSSVARLGLFIHVTADLIDIGSVNQWTLQLHAVQPLVVYPGMLIGQVTFWRTEGEITLYRGKYQGSRGPAPSQSYRDFEDE